MSLTINGATNTLTAASGLAIAGNTAVTGTLSATGIATLGAGAFGSGTTNTAWTIPGLFGGTSALELGATNSAVAVNVIGYGVNNPGVIMLGNSASTTNGTFSSAGNGNYLAEIGFSAVNSSNVKVPVALIEAQQLNSSGVTYVGGTLNIKMGTNVAAPATVASFTSTGLAVAGTLSASGITSVTDATDATSTTAASLKTAGGLGVAKKLCVATSSTGETNQADLIAAKAWIGDAVAIISLSNTTTVYPALVFGKGDTAGTASALNDVLGQISFVGCTNGVAERVTGAYIRSVVDTGTWIGGVNRKSNLEFYPGSALALSMSSAGVVNVATATDATSTTAAAFTVTGGVGIAKKLYVGDNIVMASGKALQTVAGYIEGSEMTAPAAGAANSFRIFAEDNGAGKTRLMVQFATGAAQQLAIEP
jgi:hypothetical protein